MKKILFSIAVIGILGFLTVQYADAGRGWYMNRGPGCPCWNGGYTQVQNDASQKNVTAFLQATEGLRKQLTMKQAEYEAVMNAATPDPAKAATVSGEIYQIRNQIRTKAVDAGLNRGYGRGGGGNGYGPGYGLGGGRGPCRGFMY
jgi:zinc resistance-associated protein